MTERDEGFKEGTEGGGRERWLKEGREDNTGKERK